MNIELTKWTKTKDVIPLLDVDTINGFLEKLPEVQLKKPILDFTLKEFGELLEDEEAYIRKLFNTRRLFTALGRLKSYRRQMKEINAFLKLYEMPQTKEERAAAQGIIFPDMVTKMVLSVIKFFGYKSIWRAERVKLRTYLMIFQEEASGMMYQRKYNDIINAQIKANSKKK